MPAKKVSVVDLSEFRRTTKPGCGFGRLTIDDSHADTLKAAMTADDISSASIHEWMKKREYVVSLESIRKHRRGVCSCPN